MYNQYDPGRVVASFRGVLLEGFAEGSFISAERNEDGFTTEVGAAGDVTRTRSRNRTGLVTFTLQAAAPGNDMLSAIATLDELTGAGAGPLLVKYLDGTTALAASTAWIKKYPTVEFGAESGSREWVIECAELLMHVGGNVL